MNIDNSSNRNSLEMKEPMSYGKYTRGALIGMGGYKKVYKAYDSENGVTVAWNQIKVGPNVDFGKLKSEVNILQSISHENIIECYDFWFDSEKLKCVFITEFMTSGDLRKFIQMADHVFRGAIKDYCRQILNGLYYLHSKSPPIIHRDIKLDNIFFSGSNRVVKIGDLGLATVLEGSRKQPLSVIGTANFMAPETFNNQYNQLVDIWAFGMCVIEMATLDYPYSECSIGGVYRKILDSEMPRSLGKILDPDVLSFVLHCLAPAETRLSAEQLLKHPFLTQNHEDDKVPITLREESQVDEFIRKINENPEEFLDVVSQQDSDSDFQVTNATEEHIAIPVIYTEGETPAPQKISSALSPLRFKNSNFADEMQYSTPSSDSSGQSVTITDMIKDTLKRPESSPTHVVIRDLDNSTRNLKIRRKAQAETADIDNNIIRRRNSSSVIITKTTLSTPRRTSSVDSFSRQSSRSKVDADVSITIFEGEESYDSSTDDLNQEPIAIKFLGNNSVDEDLLITNGGYHTFLPETPLACIDDDSNDYEYGYYESDTDSESSLSVERLSKSQIIPGFGDSMSSFDYVNDYMTNQSDSDDDIIDLDVVRSDVLRRSSSFSDVEESNTRSMADALDYWRASTELKRISEEDSSCENEVSPKRASGLIDQLSESYLTMFSLGQKE